jgi:uncharacterized protein
MIVIAETDERDTDAGLDRQGNGASRSRPGAQRTVLYSATDLTAAATCEFALVRRLDAKLGRIDPLPEVVDDMLERAARLGDAHELRTLESYRERYGAFDGVHASGVAEIERPEHTLPAELLEKQADTVAALRAGADVVFQATFFDGRFLGFADFLIKTPSGAYEVYDTKLARHAKVTALLQLAAYADQLHRLGIPTGEQVHLLLGDGTTSSHRLRDILPVYLDRRARLEQLLDNRLAEDEPVRWGDPRYAVDGRCDVCAPEVEAHRDLQMVAAIRITQRARLLDAGITTIDELAASTGPVAGLPLSTVETLRDQARMQVTGGDGRGYRVFDTAALAGLPLPDEGDIFFDFEGDPLYSENAGPEWGLDYLFGVVEPDERFRPFWAHDYAEEREALRAFLDYVTERRQAYPGMHIYHYANYERDHLQKLTARHGVGEEQLDELLRGNVLVDLYPVVKKSVRVSTRSYGLKKLEPLYMGDLLRQSDVTTGGDSIIAYVRYTELRDAGEADAAAALLQEIADYNEYDCLSTLRLRDWLLGLGAERGILPAPRQRDLEAEAAAVAEAAAADLGAVPASVSAEFEPSALYRDLMARVPADPADRTPDHTAIALAAAAIDYHRREVKSFWWEHFNRLEQPVEEWADTRDVFIVTDARVEHDWYRGPAHRTDRRELSLRGELAPGSRLDAGERELFAVYDPPHPWPAPLSRASDRVAHARTAVVDAVPVPGGGTRYVLEERLTQNAEPYAALPMALTPSAPPRTESLEAAIAQWGLALAGSLPAFPADAAIDLLRRRPPRRRDGGPLAPVPPGAGSDAVSLGIRDSLLALDSSYLAVQGPPGTGKTYTGARVIADLVLQHGWSVGVVAQSHSVVENMLDAIVAAGVPARQVGKVSGRQDALFTALQKDGQARFLADAQANAEGAVVGGTAWDFTNQGRVSRRRLDLLVVDEAGQYSLANTIAVSVAARNLLLLGDPQQLPQVTQGIHPEPVDASALGWLSDGHDVLPAELGYFLAESWRMHPDVCAPVSELSYEGELHARVPVTTDRMLEGVAPGLRLYPVEHRGNATQSSEEAERVLEIVDEISGRPWTDPSRDTDRVPLGDEDIIVVAPFNAQVELLRAALDAAGHQGIPVGTVDKFQGREAAVAIVSLSASSAAEVPRGIGFLLMKNRLNVAISRAKWAAYLVYSPALTHHLPYNPAELAMLSGFLRLTRPAEAPRAW